MAKYIRFGSRTIKLPGNRLARIALGTALMFCGMLWFLPVLGLWMIPLGLIVLSVDLLLIRRFRRRILVRYGKGLKRRWPGLWEKLV